ncbi:MAG: hypothetical protein RJQ10_15420 [Haliea sp.]|uniref:hypothetical protein n=1 Tax=Haliea sp. TaxID=1932666 RepID=UPI0032EED9B7
MDSNSMRTYMLADMPITEDAEGRIDHYLGADPRRKHGQVSNNLGGDFAIDIPALRERRHHRLTVKRH